VQGVLETACAEVRRGGSVRGAGELEERLMSELEERQYYAAYVLFQQLRKRWGLAAALRFMETKGWERATLWLWM
jgi:hypothetical protein